jgi:predicted HTH domain antitoxin
MNAIQLEVPDEVLACLNETPGSLARELPLLAAVKLFELGRLSSGRAAQLAGMERVEFLRVIGRYQVSGVTANVLELEHDASHA